MNRLKQSLSSISTPALPSFGSSLSSSTTERATEPPLEQARLAELAARQKLTSNLLDACSQLHRALAKERPDPRNAITIPNSKTKLPVEWLATVMTEGAEEMNASLTRSSTGEVESYAQAVASVGDMHAQLASLSATYHEQLVAEVLAVLERRTEDFKDWEKALKDAEKKRTALDAVMAKIEKGKKDPAEYEQDLDAAQWAYTDSRHRLQRRADQLDHALGEDREAAQQLVAVQLEFARNYVSLLEDCQSTLGTSTARSARSRPPPLPQRSTATASSTRMARSQSESSVQDSKPVISPTIYSVLGPNRSRGNTVSSISTEKDRDSSGTSTAKSRSRSGSVLDRFAFGGRAKKKDANGDGGDDDEGRLPASPREQNSSSPSRFTPAIPNLPTLGSLRKLSVQGNAAGGKYGALGDAEDYYTAPPSPTRFASHGEGSHPPTFRRSQTAPTTASSSSGSLKTSSPTSPGFRRVPPVPSLPSRGPVGRIYRAQWAYTPATGSSHGHGSSTEDGGAEDDLALNRGDLVRIEEEITADWWKGVVVSGAGRGQRGMLPSAYVVPHDGDASSRPTATSSGAGTTSEARWRSMTADDAHSSAPETSSDGHGHDTDTDGDEGLLPEEGEPRWSIDSGGGGGAYGQESPFGDDRVSHAHAIGRTSR